MPKFDLKSTNFIVRLNPRLLKKFDDTCQRVGVTRSRMVRLLIDEWCHIQYIHFCKTHNSDLQIDYFNENK